MTDDHDLQPPPVTQFIGQSPGRGPETAYRTAHDLLSRRAPREALEVLEPALEQEPRNTGLRSLRAWAYLLRAQLAKAEEELAALVEERPDDDWARHALGRSLERQARLQRGAAAPAPRRRDERRPRARAGGAPGRATAGRDRPDVVRRPHLTVRGWSAPRPRSAVTRRVCSN